MLIISEELKNKYKNYKYKVYSIEPLAEGVECYSSINDVNKNNIFYVSHVNANNIKYNNGKFYFTEDALSDTADWFPAQIINVCNNFIPYKKRNNIKCVSQLNNNIGKSIKSNKCIVDVSNMSAFNGINEDASIFEYRVYLTLFNDYTIKQLVFDRYDLFTIKIKSSKYDLVAKLQDANFLKSKDFVIINNLRKNNENIKIGVVLKSTEDKSNIEYGYLYINMNNLISIKWK